MGRGVRGCSGRGTVHHKIKTQGGEQDGPCVRGAHRALSTVCFVPTAPREGEFAPAQRVSSWPPTGRGWSKQSPPSLGRKERPHDTSDLS